MLGFLIWMALWWSTEVVPLGITALLPLVIFPLTGIASTADVSTYYAKDVVMLFIGGFLIAYAMEKWGLHKRIAFKLISITGSSPLGILLGFMFSAWLLSMWISNTATTVMLIPPAIAVIKEIRIHTPEKITNTFSIGLLLSIAYSASIGGAASLIGTPTNLIFHGLYNDLCTDNCLELSFFGWMKMALPISFCMLLATIYILKRKYTKQKLSLPKHHFKLAYQKLGPFSVAEKIISIVFVFLVFAWLTRKEVTIGASSFFGWGNYFNSAAGRPLIKDSTIAVLFAILLFLIPAKRDTPLLSIQELKKIPLNIILLFGGGFALSYGFKASGLDIVITNMFQQLPVTSPYVLSAIICFFVLILTEFSSNAATISLITPVLWHLGISLNISPLILLIPATLACSMAFMFPISTPPNAVIMETNQVPIQSMIRTGLILNITGLLIIQVFSFFLIS